jgi:hypothetical protein
MEKERDERCDSGKGEEWARAKQRRDLQPVL